MFAFWKGDYVLMEHEDYNKKYKNQKGTSQVTLYWEDGTKRFDGHYRKVNNIWGNFKIGYEGK